MSPLGRSSRSPDAQDAMSSSDLSQPETEPLPFEEDEDDRDQMNQDELRDEGQDQDADGESGGDEDVEDEEMFDAQHEDQNQNGKRSQGQDMELVPETNHQRRLPSAAHSINNITSNHSPLKAANFTQDEFSGSDLTDEDDSDDGQAGNSTGRSAKVSRRGGQQEQEEDEEDIDEDGGGVDDDDEDDDEDEEGLDRQADEDEAQIDKIYIDDPDAEERDQGREQEGVEGEEDDEEDHTSNSSGGSSIPSSDESNDLDPDDSKENRLRRGTRTRTPVIQKGKRGSRKSKPRRASIVGGSTPSIPSGAVPTIISNTGKSTPTGNARGRPRGRGRGGRGRGRGTSSRGTALGGYSTREGTATDTQQDTDLETNADEDDLDVEDGKEASDDENDGGADEADGLDGLAALATASSTGGNDSESVNTAPKIKGKNGRGMSSSGMGMLANAPQISVVDEEQQHLLDSARTSRETSINPDVMMEEDLEAEAEAQENDEGIRKIKAGQKLSSSSSLNPPSKDSLALMDPSSSASAGLNKNLVSPVVGAGVAEAEESGAVDSDLAAQHRQEAIEQLTKIEIMFAKLRDRLYIERMEELRKEAEMVLEGTHPDLVKLTNIIETQRDSRLRLVEAWLEREETCVEEIAKADEEGSWSSWRNDAVELRRSMMDETARKKRRLDREKRTLDVPRPTRRYQAFEAELTPTPRFNPLRTIESQDAQASHRTAKPIASSNSKRKAGKQRATAAAQIEDDLEVRDRQSLTGSVHVDSGQIRAGEFVAYPGLRGLESNDVWNDLETMGIAPLSAAYAHDIYAAGHDGYARAPDGYYYEDPRATSFQPYLYEDPGEARASRRPDLQAPNRSVHEAPAQPQVYGGDHRAVAPNRGQEHPLHGRDLERATLKKEGEVEGAGEKEPKKGRNKPHQPQQQQQDQQHHSSANDLASRVLNQQVASSNPSIPTSHSHQNHSSSQQFSSQQSLKAGQPLTHLFQYPQHQQPQPFTHSSSHNGGEADSQMNAIGQQQQQRSAVQ